MDKEQIAKAAEVHDGRYLLARRYHTPKPWAEKTDLDHAYDACEELVKEGRARWIKGNFAPGIELVR
ncbi:MAG: hypothetical protein IH994_06060 [Proteobacteria bacterium]|nr:hypothetical protein [Pseudomonadota bacterium]